MSDIDIVAQIVQRKDGFTQVCVWPGTIVVPRVSEFEQFMLDELKARVQYLEEVITLPDIDENGVAVPDTGGRNDVLFAVHSDDIGNFAVPRLAYGIRWIEDVLAECNHNRHLYDAERLDQYKGW